MIKRMLVPTDGSDMARRGVTYALALAERHGASIMALHVVDVKLLEGPFLRDISASLGTAPYVNYTGNISSLLEAHGASALEEVERLCAERGVPCETTLATGIVPRVIVETGALADLIVLGRGGEHSPWLEGLAGSTAQAVVRRASTPVLVTGAAAPEGDKVVVAYDGSPHARKALRTGADVAREWGMALHLVTVRGDAEAVQREALGYLESRDGLEIVCAARQGDAGEEISAYAGESGAAVIVMGAFGHSKLRQLVVGSTTAYVLHSAPCPLLLLH